MKPRLVHDVVVTPYDFWAQPDRPPQYEWICCCGALQSGYADAAHAETGGQAHAEPFNRASMTATTSGGHRSMFDAETGVWRSAGAAAFLGVGLAGWVAFGVLAAVVAIVAVGFAVKGGQAPVPDLPPWLADVDQEGGPATPVVATALERCPSCLGRGFLIEGATCERCDGTGWVDR